MRAQAAELEDGVAADGLPPPAGGEQRPLLSASDADVKREPTPRSAIALMLLLNFLGSMGFSIVLPSLYPFIKSASLTGWAVAVNSAGTLVSSPIFGYWSDKRNFGEVLAISLAIGVVANVAYALSFATWMVLVARFLVGFANGNNSILNSFLAYATSKDNRTLIYALNSASGVLGFILGPAVAALATFPVFQFNIPIGRGQIVVDELTLPGYLSAAMLFLCIILLIFFFQEARRPATRTRPRSPTELLAMPKDTDKVPLGPVCVLIFFNFAFTAVFTILETIGTPYTTEFFDWSVADNSWMWTGVALAAVAVIFGVQMVIHFFMSHLNYERILLMVSQVVLVVATALLAEASFTGPLLWKFLVGVGIGTLGYSMTTVLTISLFSKLLEGFEQGTWMGIFNASGGLARIVAPILGAYALEYGNGRWVFTPSFLVATASFIVNIIFWAKLVPRLMPGDVVEQVGINSTKKFVE